LVIVCGCGPDDQLLQPCGQKFELLVCAEFVQAVNADLDRLGVVVGDIVDVFGVAHLIVSVDYGAKSCKFNSDDGTV
jgi:hypothetical protein